MAEKSNQNNQLGKEVLSGKLALSLPILAAPGSNNTKGKPCIGKQKPGISGTRYALTSSSVDCDCFGFNFSERRSALPGSWRARLQGSSPSSAEAGYGLVLSLQRLLNDGWSKPDRNLGEFSKLM